MKKNVGGWDRAFRAVFGLAVIGVGAYARSWWGALGLVPLGSAMFARCPTYLAFGMSTAVPRDREGPPKR